MLSKPKTKHEYVIGIDFGTLSGRAVVVRVSDGEVLSQADHIYKNKVIDTYLGNKKLPPDWALQDSEDYIDVLKTAVPEAIRKSNIDPESIIGIGTDFTACTVLPVLKDGTALSMLPEYKNRPHAYVKLWKHHAAQSHADRINTLAKNRSEPWLENYGGFISSEWEFAKALQVLEEDEEIYNITDHWVEAADWIVWQLCGEYVRNACSAGYKGILQEGKYPNSSYLKELNPKFANFVHEKLDWKIGQLGDIAGTLSEKAAKWIGLKAGIAVAVGNVDAHVTAPAAKAIQPGQMVAIMGTSTCHVMNSEIKAPVPGMCGVVKGGITPNYYGYEAGQSGVGDIFAWFVNNFVPQKYYDEAAKENKSIHQYLSDLSAKKTIASHGLICLDWQNGNRSILVNHDLSGVILGLSISTPAEDVYRALLEASAFGAKKIIDTFNKSGVPVKEFIAAGGLIKNPILMQIYSDVLAMPISVIGSEQGPALGSAIHAAVAAKAYPNIEQASEKMGKIRKNIYTPNIESVEKYQKLYDEYTHIHDYFGDTNNPIMLRLKQLKINSLL